MIRVFVNGLAASAGGGVTYLRNLIAHLANRADVEATILLSPAAGEFASAANITFLDQPQKGGAARRFLREQLILPRLIRQSGAQVLISTGNFALRRSPVPQILLSRNALYTSKEFARDLRTRGHYGLLLDTRIKAWLARRSIRWSDRTVAPSASFAAELREWTGAKVDCIHHGFDPSGFMRDSTPLPEKVRVALGDAGSTLRLLFVSHYNYYRNFETLFRALPLLKARPRSRPFKLFLTCKLDSAENPGAYRAEGAKSLVDRLGVGDAVAELGTIPYAQLHNLYRACDIYVTPAYAESFAHPLVEAMSCRLPIVASDLPVHREICGNAALYFPCFSAQDLAERVMQVVESPALAGQLSNHGSSRVQDFSWERHVDQMLALATELLEARRNG
jgi:glycosyltransferase involved in cell wall biosynthesis